MKEFIKSLNKEQKQGLVDLFNNRSHSGIISIVDEHLKGNDGPYNQLFGSDESNPGNEIDSNSSQGTIQIEDIKQWAAMDNPTNKIF